MTTPAFPELLSAIGDRSAPLRTAAAAAGLTAPVPGCPGWSVRDLLAHLGEVQRFWAAVVTAGPGRPPPGEGDIPGRKPSGDLLAWSGDSTAWQVDLGDAGAAPAPPPGGPARPAATVGGSASDLILFLYSRATDGPVHVDGDQGLVRSLLSWLPTD